MDPNLTGDVVYLPPLAPRPAADAATIHVLDDDTHTVFRFITQVTPTLVIYAITMLLCITTTTALVAVQQLQIASLENKFDAFAARADASSYKIDSTVSQIVSKLTIDIESPLQEQAVVTGYTLVGIQETYEIVNRLRDAFIMLVNMLQQQQRSQNMTTTAKALFH
jgi:hypothetical protein